MKNKSIGDWLKVALISAISLILMQFIRVPLVPTAPFLTCDFSEVPALMLAFVLGTWAGVAVIVIKNLTFFLLSMAPWEFVGIPANIIMGVSLVGISSYLYRRKVELGVYNRSEMIRAFIWGGLLTSLLMLPVNVVAYWLMANFFTDISLPSLTSYIVAMVLPFNLLKCFFTCLVVGMSLNKILFLVKKR
ncbi:ECF transporter S component [bacterium]|nr:ECF transporter S component [bacterium]